MFLLTEKWAQLLGEQGKTNKKWKLWVCPYSEGKAQRENIFCSTWDSISLIYFGSATAAYNAHPLRFPFLSSYLSYGFYCPIFFLYLICSIFDLFIFMFNMGSYSNIGLPYNKLTHSYAGFQYSPSYNGTYSFKGNTWWVWCLSLIHI